MRDEKLVIYHNPSCSKSRQTLQLLGDNNQTPEIIEYLEKPPGREELKRIIAMLGLSPRDLVRTTEAAYKTSGLDDDSISDDEIIDALCEFPTLLQRPIVVFGNKAVIGRPPIKVLDLFA